MKIVAAGAVIGGSAGGISQAFADARYLQIGQGGITQAFADNRYVQFAIAFQAFRFDTPGGMGVGIYNLDASKQGSAGLAMSLGSGAGGLTLYGVNGGGPYRGIQLAGALRINAAGPGAPIILDAFDNNSGYAGCTGMFCLDSMSQAEIDLQTNFGLMRNGFIVYNQTTGEFQKRRQGAWVNF